MYNSNFIKQSERFSQLITTQNFWTTRQESKECENIRICKMWFTFVDPNDLRAQRGLCSKIVYELGYLLMILMCLMLSRFSIHQGPILVFEYIQDILTLYTTEGKTSTRLLGSREDISSPQLPWTNISISVSMMY